MLSIERIRSLLPAANIKSVVLNDPKTITLNDEGCAAETCTWSDLGTEKIRGFLNVKVKTTVITPSSMFIPQEENLNAGFMSIPGFDFSDHLRVAVIQSRDKDLSEMLQSMGDQILKYIGPLDGWSGNVDFNDRLLTNVVKKKSSTYTESDLPAFKGYAMSVQTKRLFGDFSGPILDKIDNDGNKIKSVPLDFDFTINTKSPIHLSYFVVSYLDILSLAESAMISSVGIGRSTTDTGVHQAADLGLTALDFTKIGGFNTPLNFDVIFSDGRLSASTYFFKMPNGKLWTGPVHRSVPSGRYKTGNAQSDTNTSFLEVVKTSNVKVQDFRQRDGVMNISVMDDFQNEQEVVRNIIRGFRPKIRSLTPGNQATHPYVSELFLSTGGRKHGKFMFLINMDMLLTHNSVYGKVIRSGRLSVRNSVWRKSIIKSLKVYRQTVKRVKGTNKLGSPVNRFLVQDEAPVLVASVTQPQGSNIITPSGNLVEETTMSFSPTGIRSFNVSDRNFARNARGQYRYWIELEVKDGTADYFRGLVSELGDLSDLLENYLSDVSNMSIRPEEWRDNPYVQETSGGRAFSRNRQAGGYDPRFDNLTSNFAILMRNKYGDELVNGINKFIEVLILFTLNQEFNISDQTNLVNFLNLVTNPSTTNPNSILSFIQLVRMTMDKMSSFIGENVETTSVDINLPKYITSNSNSSQGIIYVKKKFSEILDLSRHGNGAYDYLSSNSNESLQDSSNQIGLKSMTGTKYRERANKETIKYFTTSQPNLTEGLSTMQGTQFAGPDSVAQTSLTYFSPAIIKINPTLDLLNADRIGDSTLMNMVQSQIVSLTSTSQNTGNQAPPNQNFMMQANQASNQNTSTQQTAPPQQSTYFTQGFSMIPTPPTPPVATSDQTGIGILNSDPPMEDAEKSSPIKPLPKESPVSFMSTLFNRSIAASCDAAITERSPTDISKFDLNEQKTYLKGVPQTEVSKLPNQIKELFISITTGNGGDVRFRPLVRKNIFADPNQAATATMKYKLLVQVEYLQSFSSSTIDDVPRPLVAAPIWKRLDRIGFEENSGKKILCRLRKFEIPEWGIVRPTTMDVQIFDEYFLITPDGNNFDADVAIPPGAFLDPGNPNGSWWNERAKAGWTNREEDYAPWREFGIPYLPPDNPDLRSQRLTDLKSQLEELRKGIEEDEVVDLFLWEARLPGRYITLLTKAMGGLGQNDVLAELEGIKNDDTAAALAADAAQSELERIRGEEEAAAALKEKMERASAAERLRLLRELEEAEMKARKAAENEANDAAGDTGRSLTVTGKLGELRTELKMLENDIVALSLEKQTYETQLAQFNTTRASLTQQVSALGQSEDDTAARNELMAQMGQLNATIDSLNTSKSQTTLSIEEKRIRQQEILLEIREEARQMQKDIITRLIVEGQIGAGQCAHPEQLEETMNSTNYTSTDDLQAQYYENLNKIADYDNPDPEDVVAFAQMGNFLSGDDRDEFEELMKELLQMEGIGGGAIAQSIISQSSDIVQEALELCMTEDEREKLKTKRVEDAVAAATEGAVQMALKWYETHETPLTVWGAVHAMV